MDGALKIALEDIMMQVMQMINKNARQRGRTIDFKEILYGYRRINPMYSADYILDLMLVYRKHKGRRMTGARASSRIPYSNIHRALSH